MIKNKPLISFIVLSYNYEKFIGKTIQSILEQTVQDFEIIVVDDCSKDNSLHIIKSFKDPRIKILCNQKNIGGAASYNRAILASKGSWLVNLDADDWILPTKVEKQLDAIKAEPDIDIIGTYVHVLDENGLPHDRGPIIEAAINKDHNFNLVKTWIGNNSLCRSSTMIRRSSHMHFGIDDPSMIYAPDYELWTRAFSNKNKFKVIPLKLTCMRTHERGVTYANPLETFLEMTFSMIKNLIPYCEDRCLNSSIVDIINWVCSHHEFISLLPNQRCRLLGLLLSLKKFDDFNNFKTSLFNINEDFKLEENFGRRILILLNGGMIDSIAFNQNLPKHIHAFLTIRSFCSKIYQKIRYKFIK